jgi:hypothetical protein
MMGITSRLIFLFILTLLAATGIDRVAAQQPQPRVALIIGNAAYQDAEAPLKDPVNSARSLTDELRRNGFEVDIGENLTREAMGAALDRFYGKIRSGSVALLFFSGYGIQSERQTYMIPINAQIWTEPDVRRDGYSVDAALAEMNKRGARIKIAILDASRRNPFEPRFRALAGGLGPVDLPNDTVVIYAAAPTRVAADGADNQSAFMSQLLKELRAPVTIEEVFNRTRIGVARATANSQVPWVASSLSEDFSLAPSVASSVPAPTASAGSRPGSGGGPRPGSGSGQGGASGGSGHGSSGGQVPNADRPIAVPPPSSPAPAPSVAQTDGPIAAPPPPSPVPRLDPFEQLRLTTEQYLKSVPARYNVPDYLTYGQSKEISFVLEPQGVGTGADRLTGMPGEVATAIVQVSPHVKALLTGPIDLVEIRPRGGDEAQRKAVTLSAPVQWVWDVKAVGVGTAILQLDLISFIPNNEKDASLQVSTFRRQIPIEISAVDRVKRVVAEISPLWAFLAAVVTALGGTFAFFGWKPTFGRSRAKNDT